MAVSKPSLFSSAPLPINPVIGPNGIVDTAVPPPLELEQPRLPGSPEPKLRSAQVARETFEPEPVGEFFPRTQSEAAQIRSGSTLSAMGQMVDESVLRIFSYDPTESQAVKDRKAALIENAYRTAPVTTFLAASLTAAGSDLIVDAPLAMLMSPAALAMSKLTKAAGWVNTSRKIVKGVARVRRAQAGKEGIIKGLAIRRAYDFVPDLMGATVSRSIQVGAMDRDIRLSDAITEIGAETFGGMILGEGIRGIGKGIKRFRKHFVAGWDEDIDAGLRRGDINLEQSKELKKLGRKKVSNEEVKKMIEASRNLEEFRRSQSEAATPAFKQDDLAARTSDPEAEGPEFFVGKEQSRTAQSIAREDIEGFRESQSDLVSPAFRQDDIDARTSDGELEGPEFFIDKVRKEAAQKKAGKDIEEFRRAESEVDDGSGFIEREKAREKAEAEAKLNRQRKSKKREFERKYDETQQTIKEEPKVKAEAEAKLGVVESIPSRVLADVDELGSSSKLQDLDGRMKTANAEFTANPKSSTLRRVFDLLLDNSGVSNKKRKVMLDALVSSLEGRVKSAGMTMAQYAKIRGLTFRGGAKTTPSTLISETQSVINGVLRGTSFRDLVHEVGHVIRTDLDKSQVKLFEKELGISEGRWDASAHEKWADLIENHLLGGAEGLKNKKLKSALSRVVDWIRDMYHAVLGKDISKKARDEINKLFRTRGEPVAVPTEGKQVGLARELREQKILDLEAPKRKKLTPEEREAKIAEKEAKLKEKERLETEREKALDHEIEVQERVRKEVQAFVEKANDPKKGVEKGALAPRTKEGKKTGAILRAMGEDTWGVTLFNSFKHMGENVKKTLHPLMLKGERLTAEIRQTAVGTIRNGLKNFSGEELAKMADDSSGSIKFKSDGKDVSKSVTMPRGYWVTLTAIARDGWDRAGNLNPSKTTGYLRLQGRKGGVIIDGKAYTLTKDYVDNLRTGKMISKGEMKMLESIEDTYASIVPMLNDISMKMNGKPLIEDLGHAYTPLKASLDTSNITEMTRLFETLLSSETSLGRVGQGRFELRKGFAPVELYDPLSTLASYVRSVSEVAGKAELTRMARALMEGAAPKIKESYGTRFYNSMQTMLSETSGNRPFGLKDSNPMTTLLLQLRRSSILARVSTGVKQLMSLGMVDTARLGTSMKELASSAIEFNLSNSKLKNIVSEMTEKSPELADRWESRGYLLDLDRPESSLSGIMLAKGELSIKTLTKLATQSKMGKAEIAAEGASKQLFLIKREDQAAIGAIWVAAKKKASSEGLTEGTPAYWKRVSDLTVEEILDSQPTTSNLTRSVLQMTPGIVGRTFSSFTSYTGKHTINMITNIKRLINTPKAERTDALKKDVARWFVKGIASLAAATGVTVTAKEAGNAAYREMFMTDAQIRRARKKEKDLATKFVTRFVTDVISLPPVAGNVARQIVSAIFGGAVFGTGIPVLEEFEEIASAVSDRSWKRVVKNLLAFLGAPRSYVAGPISETLPK